jgi:hypothetical protein
MLRKLYIRIPIHDAFIFWVSFKAKVKIKLILCLIKPHAMKICAVVEVHFHAFLTSALDGGEWSASRPRSLYLQGKSPWYQLDRRLGGPQSRSGRGGEEKNSQPSPGVEP